MYIYIYIYVYTVCVCIYIYIYIYSLALPQTDGCTRAICVIFYWIIFCIFKHLETIVNNLELLYVHDEGCVLNFLLSCV